MTYKDCVPGPWPLSDNNLQQSPLSLHSRHAGPSSALMNPRHSPQGLCTGFFLPEMHFFPPKWASNLTSSLHSALTQCPPCSNPSLKDLSHQSCLPCALSSKHFLYSTVYMSVLMSQFIPPPLSFLVTVKFFFYIYDSISVL